LPQLVKDPRDGLCRRKANVLQALATASNVLAAAAQLQYNRTISKFSDLDQVDGYSLCGSRANPGCSREI
jgi:hypothetical protein